MKRINKKIEKHKLNRPPTNDWQQEFFDLHKNFFAEIYDSISHLKNVSRLIPSSDNHYRKSTSKFIKLIVNDDKNLLKINELISKCLEIRERFFVHTEKSGGFDWVTTTHSIFFVKEKKDSNNFLLENSEIIFLPDLNETLKALDKLYLAFFKSLIKTD